MPFPEYKNSSGKVIGNIVNVNKIWNPTTKINDVYITVAIGKIGCITISQFQDITDEQISAYAEYKKDCIKQQIEGLHEQLNDIGESLRELIEMEKKED